MHASFASSISGLLIEFITNVLCTAILPVSAVPIVKHQAQDEFFRQSHATSFTVNKKDRAG